MIRRMRTVAKLVLLAAAVVFVAAACSSEGLPTGYGDQRDLNASGQSTVELNWMEGCTPALSDDLAEEAEAICQCSIDTLGDLPNEGADERLDFDLFRELDNVLSSDPEQLATLAGEQGSAADVVIQVVRDCIANYVPDAS